MRRIVITRSLPEAGIASLRAAHDVQIYNVGPDTGGDENAVIEVAHEAEALISLLDNPITAHVLDNCPRLKIVAQCAVGYDNIDVEAAHAREVVVTHTPGVLTEATADFAFALLLGVARRLRAADQYVREGRFHRWETTTLLGMELAGKTLGIVGMGRIGAAVARRALGFGMKILYHNRHRANPTIEHLYSAHFASFEDLLARSDIITIHTPLNDQSHHLFNADVFRRMKPTALLVNTARGPIIDEAALVEALAKGEIAGAGLDVYEREPTVHPGLFAQDRVLLAPHLGSATVEARTAMARMCSESILAVFNGASTVPYRIA